MVAYSFAPRFAAAVESLEKRQTIRAHRKGRSRHARPGEAVQLYAGMRTRSCRKLVNPDPVCTSVRPVIITALGIRIDFAKGGWRDLSLHERNAFARRDGFHDWKDMRTWWAKTHGGERFDGVLIIWEPANG